MHIETVRALASITVPLLRLWPVRRVFAVQLCRSSNVVAHACEVHLQSSRVAESADRVTQSVQILNFM